MRWPNFFKKESFYKNVAKTQLSGTAIALTLRLLGYMLYKMDHMTAGEEEADPFLGTKANDFFMTFFSADFFGVIIGLLSSEVRTTRPPINVGETRYEWWLDSADLGIPAGLIWMDVFAYGLAKAFDISPGYALLNAAIPAMTWLGMRQP